DLEITAFGQPPPDARVRVTGPRREDVTNMLLAWRSDGLWEGSFVPETPGYYRLQLTAEDAYAFDNEATILIPSEHETHVEWLLDDLFWPNLLGWSATASAPQLQVARWPGTIATNLPMLWVGDGFRQRTGPSILKTFQERCPVLADVNLDVIEQAG